ncbi:ERD (early-responsive to dehydration stress) family protein [Trifolium repens]|nr:ERD (early-responsive to dehydration stress) family protein [Trifolium repens]
MLVRGIHVPPGGTCNEAVEQFFMDYHPSDYHSHSVVCRSSKLQILVYFDEYKCRTYSKDKLDEEKDEWAEYMFTNVIPRGSWIRDFLKT